MMTKQDYLEVGRRADGSMLIRTWLLHSLAKLVRIQFHVGGWPYGASYNRAVNAWRRNDVAISGRLLRDGGSAG